MTRKLNINLSELVYGFSSALDLVSPALVNHHRQVLGFSEKLATSLKIGVQGKGDICIAAILHDIGVVAFNREIDLVFDDKSVNDHAELGYLLMKRFAPFATAAKLVRGHHTDWSTVEIASGAAPELLGSNIIHLADRVAVKLDVSCSVLKQAPDIRRWVADKSGGMFMPELVEAFLRESAKECFWLDARYGTTLRSGARGPLSAWDVALEMDELRNLSELFRMIIDYRSSHTASHSRVVAHISEAMAKMVGFSGNGCSMIYVAGNLHDLGKLALPASILDKPGPLTGHERDIVRSHPYHTHRVLKGIRGLEEVSDWASFHHECSDGSGYPFRLCHEELPLGARIVSVADVFTALTETRLYRSDIPKNECLNIMQAKAVDGKLDPMLVSLLEKHYDDLFDLQMSVQQGGVKEYGQILQEAAPFISGSVKPKVSLMAMA